MAGIDELPHAHFGAEERAVHSLYRPIPLQQDDACEVTQVVFRPSGTIRRQCNSGDAQYAAASGLRHLDGALIN